MRLHLGYASHYGSQREGHQTPLFTLARRLTDSPLESRAKCTKTSANHHVVLVCLGYREHKSSQSIWERSCLAANTTAMFDLLLKRR